MSLQLDIARLRYKDSQSVGQYNTIFLGSNDRLGFKLLIMLSLFPLKHCYIMEISVASVLF